MSTIVTRAAKGSPLTHTEVDANFTNLNTDKIESGNTVAALTIQSATITGGAIDGTTIGGSTPAAGTFTTLTGNSTSQFGRSSANYIQAVGAATTLSPELSVLGSDTNIPFTIESKGTGAVNLAGGSRGVNISNGGTVTAITITAGGSGYSSIPTCTISAPTTAGGVQATATVPVQVSGTPTIVSGGTGYTVNDVLTVVGGTLSPTATAAQFTVSSVSGGVITGITVSSFSSYTAVPTNPVSVTGGTGSGATFTVLYSVRSTFFFPTITNAGSGYVEQPTVTFSGGGGSGAAAYATVGSATTVRGLGGSGTVGQSISFATPSGESFRVATATTAGTSVNYLTASGGATGNGPRLLAQGSDTNVFMGLVTQGTGAFQFLTNNSVEQFRVAHTASAVNYVQVTGNSTTNAPIVSTQGSDTNIGFALSSKGTGRFDFFTNNLAQLQFRIAHTASAVNYVQVTGATTGNRPWLSATGSDTNIGIRMSTKGTGDCIFQTGGGSEVTQMAITHTASAVNYVQVTGSATGSNPTISVQGSDSSRGLAYTTKGATNHNFFANNLGYTTFVINGNNASSVNYLQVASSATTAAPVLSSQGTDTNIDLTLTPKGTGYVQFGTRTASADAAITGYIEIKDSGGTIRRLAVIG